MTLDRSFFIVIHDDFFLHIHYDHLLYGNHAG